MGHGVASDAAHVLLALSSRPTKWLADIVHHYGGAIA